MEQIIYNKTSDRGRLTLISAEKDGENVELLAYAPESGTFAATQTAAILVVTESGTEEEARRLFENGEYARLAEEEHLYVLFLLHKNANGSIEEQLLRFNDFILKKTLDLPVHQSLVYQVAFEAAADEVALFGAKHPVFQTAVCLVSPSIGKINPTAPVPAVLFDAKESLSACYERANANCAFAKTVIADDVSEKDLIRFSYDNLFRNVRRWKNSSSGTLMPRIDFDAEGFVPNVDKRIGKEVHTWYEFIPKDLPRNAPLVISLHGAGTDPLYHAEQTRWHEVAKKEKFVLLFPKCGGGFFWNSGIDPEIPRDDEFVLSLIDEAERKYSIDKSRVYLTGFSSGAMATCSFGLCYPWAFAAIAPFSGSLGMLFTKGNSIICPHSERYTTEQKIAFAKEKYDYKMPVFYVSGEAEGFWPMTEDNTTWKTSQYFKEYNGIPCFGFPENPSYPMPERGDSTFEWGKDKRFTTTAYYGDNRANNNDFGLVNMTFAKDMPHAVDLRQVKTAYEYLSQFARTGDESVRICDKTINLNK